MNNHRTLIYSHDTYGLGHLRRSLTLASAIVKESSRAEVLIATGSPAVQSFRLPDRVDTVKIPAATKTPNGSYRARSLGCDLDDLVRIRSILLASLVEAYRPDVVLVDHAPIGMAGELVPLLARTSRIAKTPRLILGLRDIIDAAATVECSWDHNDVWRHAEIYDDILVYGDDTVLTTAAELDLAHRLPGNLQHVGYVAPLASTQSSTHSGLLVTVGGGGDGLVTLDAVVSYLEDITPAERPETTIVTGPLLSHRRRTRLAERTRGLGSGVMLHDFYEDLREKLARSAAVVSMAGYNTVVELLPHHMPALLIPRTSPRTEQWIRATRLSPVAGFTVHDPDTVTPGVVAAFMADAQRRPDHTLNLNGATNTARVVLDTTRMTR